MAKTKKTVVGLNEEDLLKKLTEDFADAKIFKEETFKVIAIADTTTATSDYAQDRLTVYKMWYDGDQWVYNPDGKTIDTSKMIAMPVVNYTKTIVDQKSNMLKRRKPSFDVRPVGTEDLGVSLNWNNLMGYVWRTTESQINLSQIYKDALIYGTGFGKIRWNYDEDDLEFIVLNPLDVYTDRFGKDIKDMRYLHVVYSKPKEYIKETYDVDEEEDTVTLYESWYNPNIFDEDGYVIMWTNKNILSIKSYRKVCKENKIPLIAVRPNKSTNSFWGASEVRDLSQIQAIHNKSLGFILDSLIIANNGRICTTNAELTLSNNPLELIKVNTKDELWALQLPTLDPRWFSIVQYSSYSLAQAITGTYAVNAGGAAPTTTSSGIITLQQAGNLGSESDFIDIATGMRYLGRIIISMLKKFYGKSRISKILGDDFKEEMLDIKDFDIFVDFGESLPDDRLSRNNLLLAMFQSGAITKEQYANLTGNTELIATMAETQVAAQEQNPLAALLGGGAGGQPPPNQPVSTNTAGTTAPVSPAVEEVKKRVQTTSEKVARAKGEGV